MAARHKIILFSVVLIFMAATGCTTLQTQGGAIGDATEGLAGTRLAQRNPWRGGVIGEGPGVVAGATIAEISARGSREAALREQPVEYLTEDGRGRYYAEPKEHDPNTRCRKVRERIYDDGRLLKERVKEVCAG
jgi:hypothetical protein